MPIPIAVVAVAAAYSAFSAYTKSQISNAQKREQARIAEANARTAELEGDLALKAAIGLESDSRRQTAQLIGLQRAAMSASGFAVGVGSFGDLIETSAVLGEMDAAVILFEGELEQFRKRREAESLRVQAANLRRGQSSPGLAGIGGGLSTFASLS